MTSAAAAYPLACPLAYPLTYQSWATQLVESKSAEPGSGLLDRKNGRPDLINGFRVIQCLAFDVINRESRANPLLIEGWSLGWLPVSLRDVTKPDVNFYTLMAI